MLWLLLNVKDEQNLSEVGWIGRYAKKDKGKALRPNQFSIEVWKGLGDIGVLVVDRVVQQDHYDWKDAWWVKRESTTNLCIRWRDYLKFFVKGLFKVAITTVVNWLTHKMKQWERVIDYHLRMMKLVSENQFGFKPCRLTMETI